MYFPYLRGRQFELIALRELVENNLLNEKIIPIVEPVKISSTMISTLNSFNVNGHKIAIIKNPKVGTFENDSKKDKNIDFVKKINEFLEKENIYSAVIIDNNSQDIVNRWINSGIKYENILSLCLENDMVEFYISTFPNEGSAFSVLPYSPAFRRIRNSKRILIDDKFKKLSRNNDYLKNEDEFFSDDHLYCYEDGYDGFSDYSIVGKDYAESGFAPYAVAIHIVYFAEDKSLRIHHFVSNSNDDISDPANKFYEAVTKLVNWNKKYKLDTLAIKQFEDMYENEIYPGLGVVKKLSIMHHLELIGKYFSEEEK